MEKFRTMVNIGHNKRLVILSVVIISGVYYLENGLLQVDVLHGYTAYKDLNGSELRAY